MDNKDETPIKHEECVELKNIKYKTMLLSGVPSSEKKLSITACLNGISK